MFTTTAYGCAAKVAPGLRHQVVAAHGPLEHAERQDALDGREVVVDGVHELGGLGVADEPGVHLSGELAAVEGDDEGLLDGVPLDVQLGMGTPRAIEFI